MESPGQSCQDPPGGDQARGGGEGEREGNGITEGKSLQSPLQSVLRFTSPPKIGLIPKKACLVGGKDTGILLTYLRGHGMRKL